MSIKRIVIPKPKAHKLITNKAYLSKNILVIKIIISEYLEENRENLLTKQLKALLLLIIIKLNSNFVLFKNIK